MWGPDRDFIESWNDSGSDSKRPVQSTLTSGDNQPGVNMLDIDEEKDSGSRGQSIWRIKNKGSASRSEADCVRTMVSRCVPACIMSGEEAREIFRMAVQVISVISRKQFRIIVFF